MSVSSRLSIRAGRGGKLELLLFPGKVVGAGAGDLQRRIARRHLADLADEAGQRRLDLGPGRPPVARRDHRAFGVVGVGGLPEAHREAILLVPSTAKGTVLVASPKAIGSTPVASGSSVPAWPAFAPRRGA